LNKINANNNQKVTNRVLNNKVGINNGAKNNNFGLAKKAKEKEKRDISEGKNAEKKINNFFDDIEEMDEDNMQKLNLKPTPINEPIRKKTYVQKKKNRFALQKKTKTDRTENAPNNNLANESNNNNLKKPLNNDDKNNKDEELLTDKINEEDFTEPKEEKMMINQEKEENHKFQKRKKYNKERKNEPEQNQNEEKNEEDEVKNEEIDENANGQNAMGETQNIPYIVDEQENLIANHMDIIKSEAQLLTEEGNLISKIKGITEENYSMEEYVPKIEEIIEIKLNYFRELKERIKEYKSLLG
jgi:hypothetical protein